MIGVRVSKLFYIIKKKAIISFFTLEITKKCLIYKIKGYILVSIFTIKNIIIKLTNRLNKNVLTKIIKEFNKNALIKQNKNISYIFYVTNNVAFPESLSIEDEKKFVRLMQEGNKEAKRVLIEHNLRLVAHVCKKYSSPNIDQDDIISIGSIGLIKGINTYDPNKSIKLSTYISKCIDNEVLMYFRAKKKQNKEVYLEDPIGKDKDDNCITLSDILENDEKNIEDEIDSNAKIKKLYNSIGHVLKPREREIIELRFGLNGRKQKTQREIAKKLNISRSYVSRIETKAIQKLANEFKQG